MAVVGCVPYNQLLVVKGVVVSLNLNLSPEIWHGVYTPPAFDHGILVLAELRPGIGFTGRSSGKAAGSGDAA